VVPEVRATVRERAAPSASTAGDKWHLDEVFLTINGERCYLWRAVDQDGNVLDILVQSRRDARAAKKFFRKLLKGLCDVPRVLITDKLASYSVAHREMLPSVEHSPSLSRGDGKAFRDMARGNGYSCRLIRGLNTPTARLHVASYLSHVFIQAS